MKSAFTMIELIFVIVILGLLSAIAIPKMMATKQDAQIVKEVTNAKQIMQNANAEFLSQSKFSNYASSDCYKFTPSNNGDFKVELINKTTDLCKALMDSNLSKDINNTYHFGGTKIKF